MMFKNASVFRLLETPDLADLQSLLAEKSFKPCTGIRPSSFGWVSPTNDDSLAHEVGGCFLLAAKKEDKVIPTTALADVLAEKVTRLEQLEDRPIRAKEKQRLKEDSLAELLPRALPKSKNVHGYLNQKEELLVIDTASAAEAELFINLLRDSCGSLKVMPVQVKQKPTDVFTHWLKSRKLPEHFSFGDQCDLFDPEELSAVSCRKQDLNTSEVRNHIDAGKYCTKISIIWYGDLKLVVDKDLVLRQIKVLSSDDQTEDDDDPIAQLDSAFVNMTLELTRFLPELYSAMGGETRGG